MFDVRALPRVGPVAQRLEQGTHNLNRAVLLVLAMLRLGWFS